VTLCFAYFFGLLTPFSMSTLLATETKNKKMISFYSNAISNPGIHNLWFAGQMWPEKGFILAQNVLNCMHLVQGSQT